jgi:hypothetical protein
VSRHLPSFTIYTRFIDSTSQLCFAIPGNDPSTRGYALLGVAFFPVGLLAFTSLHGGGIFILAWAFYAVLIISLFANNKKKVFYTVYTILLITIIFNLAGCYQFFKHPSH